jgi:SPP1 gp7 family putative phage head morphogenesis protein
MTKTCEHSHGPIPENVAAYFAESAYITNDVVDALLELCETEEDKRKLKALGFSRNPYEDTAGVLSFAERKVNLSSIERTFSSVEDSFLDQVRKTAEAEKKKYLAKVEAIIAKKDFEKLATVSPDFSGEIAKQYADTMKQLFETGKKTASDEMAVVSPETDKDVRGLYRAQALQMESKISNEIAITAQSEALYNVARGANIAFTMELIEKAVDNKLQKIIIASGTQAMGGAFNTGRLTVFERYKERIYGFQYTAVIDRRTTNLCLSLNGRVIGPNDPDFFRLSPPNHTNCRSFWVEILKDEFIKPAIE